CARYVAARAARALDGAGARGDGRRGPARAIAGAADRSAAAAGRALRGAGRDAACAVPRRAPAAPGRAAGGAPGGGGGERLPRLAARRALEVLARAVEPHGLTVAIRNPRRPIGLPSPVELRLLLDDLRGAPLVPALDTAAAHLGHAMGLAPLDETVAAWKSSP